MLTPPSCFSLVAHGDPTRRRKAAWLGAYAFLKGLACLCDHLADLALNKAHAEPPKPGDDAPAPIELLPDGSVLPDGSYP
jgi:hypothetical protein